MSKITVCLWFDTQAEEAARFYTALLPNSRVENVLHYGPDAPPGRIGSVLLVEFTLAGQTYSALNGGPIYKATPAASLVAHCKDQAEVDRLWTALLADGGTAVQCGWLTDKFGVSWQIVPEVLFRLLKDQDAAKVRRVTAAMMQMIKLEVAPLEAAAAAE
jgi:predicted 3-demethylubiquinone-9 3-methyltransferase (glyoxalase superfamily)